MSHSQELTRRLPKLNINVYYVLTKGEHAPPGPSPLDPPLVMVMTDSITLMTYSHSSLDTCDSPPPCDAPSVCCNCTVVLGNEALWQIHCCFQIMDKWTTMILPLFDLCLCPATKCRNITGQRKSAPLAFTIFSSWAKIHRTLWHTDYKTSITAMSHHSLWRKTVMQCSTSLG